MRVLGLVLVTVLAGCSDPLANVETLAEVDLSEDASAVEAVALPDAPDAQRVGLFARLMAPKPPLQDAPEATEAAPDEQADATAVEVAEAPAPRRGFAGLFARREKAETVAAAPEAVAEDAPKVAPEVAPEAAGVAEAAAEPEKPKGLFGFLKAKSAVEDAGNVAGEGEAVVQTASLPVAASKPARAPKSRKGRVNPNAPDAMVVPLGTVLPYGTVARVCDAPKGTLGKEVAKYPERGAKYRLYDSVPGSTGPHTFYVTGFPDGCARQLTAALVIFGSAGMHEQLRYGLPAKVQPYSETDRAYEAVKSSVCRVGTNKPCGGQLAKLEKDTVFLSIYERFEDNPRWANILLHDGQVMAADMVRK